MNNSKNGGSRRSIDGVLSYRFRNAALLERALTHRSFAHESGGVPHNEPLEFLGDAVLNFLVAERIVRRRPEFDEGAMTRLRASLVNTRSLAAEAARLELGRHLRLGKGEERSGGRRKPTLLADALEAVIGAVFLDGGVRAARTLVGRLFGDEIDLRAGRSPRHDDPKTALQEVAQGRGLPLPRYEVTEARGPDHAREFVVVVIIDDKRYGSGKGTSKKRAEQAAAAEALDRLEREAKPRARRSKRPPKRRPDGDQPPSPSSPS